MLDITQKNADEKFCSECGQLIRKHAQICPYCGVRQNGFYLLLGKNRIVAALLAFFLGGFGLHKFYLDQISQGIIYLLLCWTFIPALLGIFESIYLLCMRDDTFAQKFGH